jgi:kynurenine formamidase
MNDTRKPEGGNGFHKCYFKMACDIGTHMDSPHHWYKDGRDVSEIPVEELVSPGVIIDIPQAKIDYNPDYALSV